MRPIEEAAPVCPHCATPYHPGCREQMGCVIAGCGPRGRPALGPAPRMGWPFRLALASLVVFVPTCWYWLNSSFLMFANSWWPVPVIGGSGVGTLLFTVVGCAHDLYTGADRERRNGTQALLVLASLVGLMCVCGFKFPPLAVMLYYVVCGTGVLGGAYGVMRDRRRLRAGLALVVGVGLAGLGVMVRVFGW